MSENLDPKRPFFDLFREQKIETMNEYIKALNEFSEGEFAAFLMGIGLTWINLPYWGKSDLQFQCEKIEERMGAYTESESKASKGDMPKHEKRNPYTVLPIYNQSRNLLC